MAGNIKGIVVDIGGNTGPLEKALQGVNKTSRDLQQELTAVNKLLRLDPTNTELLNQKQKLLAESVTTTTGKLGTLKEAERQAQAQFAEGKISAEQYRALQREVVKTEQNLKGLESQALKAQAVLTKDQAVGNLKNIGKAALAVGVAVGAAFVVIGKAALDSADELQKQADITGLSTERLQELKYAGAQLGVELDVITGAQAKLTKAMVAAEKGTGAQADAFKRLKVDAFDPATGAMRDSKTVMGELFTALNGVSNETERDSLAMQLFGKSGMALNPIIKAGGDELNRLTKEARDNGAVMSNEAVAGLDKFGDTMDSLGQSIMGSVGSNLSRLMPQIQDLISKLMALPQWIQKNATLLSIIGVIIGTITAFVIAFNIQQLLLNSTTGIWAVIAGHAAISTTVLGAALKFAMGPAGQIILAIGALIAIGILLYKNWDTVSAFLSSTWNSIATTATNVFNNIKAFFVNTWDGIKTTFTNTVNSISNFITSKFGGLITIFTTIFNGYKAIFSGVWNAIKLIVLGVVLLICDLVTGNFGKLKTDAVKILNGLQAAFSQIWNGIKTIVATLMTSLVNGAIATFNGLLAFFRNLPGTMQSLGSNMMNSLKNGISSVMSTIRSVIINGINASTSFITSLPGKALQWGKDFINGLKNGIMSAINGIANAVSGIASKIRGFLHFSTPDEGPLADYESWMPDFMGGLAKGIEKSKYLVANAVKGLSSDVNIGMNLTPAMAGIGSTGNSASQGSTKQGDTNINFNGTYSFADNNSIDYLMNRAGQLVQRRKG